MAVVGGRNKPLWQIGMEAVERNLGGRPPKFKTPAEMLDKVKGYLQWCDDNQVILEDSMRVKAEGKTFNATKVMRPYTLDGFCTYAGIGNYNQFKKDNCERNEKFRIVFNALESIVREQQITGATVGLFKENIVARLNGLADKSELEASGVQIVIERGKGKEARKTEEE